MPDAYIQMLTIREWSDKVYGNTYMSIKACVFTIGSKQFIVTIPFVYGRGVDAAKREVTEALKSHGVISRDTLVDLAPFRDDTCVVARRKDLHRNGRNHDLKYGSSLISIN